MHVCIVGAGIVGLATAWALQQAGHHITVVDRAPGPAQGASGGNGAQLSYSYVQPLADPGIWKMLPRLLLEKDSPLAFRLRADPAQWAWGLRFLGACNAHASAEGTRALLALAENWDPPTFPLTGEEVMRAGVPKGPLVGEAMREVEIWWIDQDFIEDKLSVIERLKAVVQGMAV